MRVFLAGATGVIGRSLVPVLLGAGHHVTGLTRSEEGAKALRALGAEPVVCDVFDAEGLRRAVQRAEPEAVVHQLTAIPRSPTPRRYATEFAGNDRVRVEGTRNLVSAALSAGVSRLVAQSVAFFYAPVGGPVKTEDDPLYDEAPFPLKRAVRALRFLEAAVTGTEGVQGVALRYGVLYGPDTGFARDGHFAGEVRRGRFPIVGRGDGIASFAHVDDVAAATRLALERAEPGVYNVVDDEPAAQREWLPVYAERLGARPPRRAPVWLARMAGGPLAVYLGTQSRGASNAKAKRDLRWTLAHPSWRSGFGM